MSNQAEEPVDDIQSEPEPVGAENSADSRRSLWGDPVDENRERGLAQPPPPIEGAEELAEEEEEEEEDTVDDQVIRRLERLEHKPVEPPVDSRIPVMQPIAPPPTERAPDEQDDDDVAALQGEESDDDGDEPVVVGAYDPAEFQHLPVATEVKELFQFIEAYRPQTVEIEPVLKPFVLEYVPSVGDIDAFIKIPRPDEVDDNLGLLVLDEPCAKQSDPTVLDLHFRAISKDTTPKSDIVVKKLERADKNAREIEQWIANISDLHKSKPPTNVNYSKPMPDIDSLMQEWPPEFEEMLKKVELPSADMDISMEQYIDLICSVLDIPVHKSRIQSLHVLFTLYSEFKNSQHFKALAEGNQMDNEMKDELRLGMVTRHEVDQSRKKEQKRVVANSKVEPVTTKYSHFLNNSSNSKIMNSEPADLLAQEIWVLSPKISTKLREDHSDGEPEKMLERHHQRPSNRSKSLPRTRHGHQSLLRSLVTAVEEKNRPELSSTKPENGSYFYTEELQLLKQEGFDELYGQIRSDKKHVNQRIVHSSPSEHKSLKSYGMQTVFCHMCSKLVNKAESVGQEGGQVVAALDTEEPEPVWDLKGVDSQDSETEHELKSSSKMWSYNKRFDSDSD